MSRRADLLDFAVLGLLHETPMHGYELRKRLNSALGAFRALSYGSLYPCLRESARQGVDPRDSRGRPDGPARGSTAGADRL
ncbi:MAG: PadR family transcriptional regulator [Dermatophilaceae bacterium]